MFGFIVGTLCLIGLVKVVSGGHRRGWHGHRHRSCHRRGRKLGGGGAFRAASEVFKRRLDLDDDQGDIVDHALRDLKDAVFEFGTIMKDSRPDLADAFRSEKVDDGALAAAFARHDEELTTARRGVVSALKQVHAVLDPDQREQAADWLGSARPGWSV